MQKKVTRSSYIYKCDTCGLEKEFEKKPQDWFVFMSSKNDCLRLYEKKEIVERYESFNIPNKQEKVFCSMDCVLKFLDNESRMFVAELKRAPNLSLLKQRKKL